MTILSFVLGFILGVCSYAIARWIEYFLEVRRHE